MHSLGLHKSARAVAIVVLAVSVMLGLATTGSSAEESSAVVPTTDVPADDTAAAEPTTPPGAEVTVDEEGSTSEAPPVDEEPPPVASGGAAPSGAPYGDAYPVTVESDFSRPYRAISSASNSDFTLLNDLERLIRGSYKDPKTGKLRPYDERKTTYVYMTISRMENSYRVGRELIAAARNGVKVRVIHGEASQSKESRALQRSLNSSKLRDSNFRICKKGKSLACLSTVSGAIMHSKILLINRTYTRDKKRAQGAMWTGSANLGGPSGQQTYNNGLTVYNDQKLFSQMKRLFESMYTERNVGNDMINHLKSKSSEYGLSGSAAKGYTRGYSTNGMFYSNLANVTVYPTPIYATPTNGKDPVLGLLNRVIPDSQCRIRLQQNRFKYRRIAVAYKLAELANKGCKVSIVSFEDDLKLNRTLHCQQYIRVCRPILDVFKTSNRRIDAYYAKPHDKTILVEALLRKNSLNPEEVGVDGSTSSSWPSRGVRTRLVQAGSAALTGSNLIASDEVTTETTDAGVYDAYLQHWKAILKSHEVKAYPY